MALLDSVSVGDVLAYRNLWNDYVMNTIRAVNLCADSFDALASDTAKIPQGYTPDQLRANATAYRNVAGAYLDAWNQFAGSTPEQIVAESTVILTAYQETVKKVGALHATNTYCSDLQNIKAPLLDLQNEVLSRAEALGIVSHGVLQFFTDSATTGLQVVAKEVVKPIAETAARSLWDAIPWWGWGIAAVAGLVVVGPPVLAATAPLLALRSSHHD